MIIVPRLILLHLIIVLMMVVMVVRRSVLLHAFLHRRQLIRFLLLMPRDIQVMHRRFLLLVLVDAQRLFRVNLLHVVELSRVDYQRVRRRSMLSPRGDNRHLPGSTLRPRDRRLHSVGQQHSLSIRLHRHRHGNWNVHVLLRWNLQRRLHATADHDVLGCWTRHRVVRADETQLRRQNFRRARVRVLSHNIPRRPVELINVVVRRRISLPHQPLHLTRQLVVDGERHVFGGVWSKVGDERGGRLRNGVNDGFAATNFHHLHARLHVVAVRVVHQVRECRERVTQRLRGLNATFLVDRQHSLQQIDELTSVDLLSQQLTALDVHLDVHLPDVIEAVEDVLAGLFAFDVRHDLILFRRY